MAEEKDILKQITEKAEELSKADPKIIMQELKELKESAAGEKTIKLPCHNIVVVLLGEELHALTPSRWGSGTITSDMKEVCKYCEDPDCLMDCPDFGEYCTDRDIDEFNRKNDEGIEFKRHRGMIDVIEALTLHHAIAGIDIETPAYIEGIETVLDAIGNNT